MTDAQLNEIEARCNAATSGPWFPQHGDDRMCMSTYYVATEGCGGDDPEEVSEKVVCVTLYQASRVASHHAGKWADDASFIAAARSDVPALVAEVKRLKGRISYLEAAEKENARMRKRLKAALDKIAGIQDEWESEGVCHACGICAGIPYEWQPTDDHCCRVMLDLWSNGEPLPWEEAARRAVAGEGEVRE